MTTYQGYGYGYDDDDECQCNVPTDTENNHVLKLILAKVAEGKVTTEEASKLISSLLLK